MPIEAATALDEAGHDALTIRDQLIVGEEDAPVASVCNPEQRAETAFALI